MYISPKRGLNNETRLALLAAMAQASRDIREEEGTSETICPFNTRKVCRQAMPKCSQCRDYVVKEDEQQRIQLHLHLLDGPDPSKRLSR